jgi:hypothetical protein
MELKKWIFVILSIVVLMIAGVICITSRAAPEITSPEPVLTKTAPQNNTPKQIPFVCTDIPEIIEPETPVKRPVIPELYGPLDNTQNIFGQPILDEYISVHKFSTRSAPFNLCFLSVLAPHGAVLLLGTGN